MIPKYAEMVISYVGDKNAVKLHIYLYVYIYTYTTKIQRKALSHYRDRLCLSPRRKALSSAL